MEKLAVKYQPVIHPGQNTPMTLSDEWEDLPYGADPDCIVCRGAGFLHPLKDNGCRDFDRMVPCKAPGCLEDSLRAYRTGAFFVRERGATNTEQTFDNFVSVPGTEQSYRYAMQFAGGKSDFIWLLIYGSPGCGKTHLANSITKEILTNGKDCRMVKSADLFSELRLGMNDNTTDQLMKRLKEMFVLIIDDFGVEYGSEWVMAKFDELLTGRFDNGRPTVVTTNLDKTQLPDRIRDRFEDKRLSRVVHNSAPSFRPTKGRGKR